MFAIPLIIPNHFHMLIEFFCWSALAFFVFMWLTMIAVVTKCKTHLHKPIKSRPVSDYPPVSILKPLTGVHGHIYQNLESFFLLKYPGRYELLFCVQDVEDPVILIVNSLQQRYPYVDTRIFLSNSNHCINPKISNLLPGYRAARYDFLYISDCDILAEPDTLTDLVDKMLTNDRIGLATHLPYLADLKPRRLGILVGYIFFGCDVARMAFWLSLISFTPPNGMSFLMRRKALIECGGLEAFGDYLAEDFYIEAHMRQRGWKHVFGTLTARQNLPTASRLTMTALANRMIRWKRLNHASSLGTYFEPLLECPAVGILGTLGFSVLWPEVNGALLFGLHCLAWFFVDYTILCYVHGMARPLQFSRIDFLLGWLVRFVTSPFIYLASLTSNTITWRNRIYRLRLGGLSVDVTPLAKDKADFAVAKKIWSTNIVMTPDYY